MTEVETAMLFLFFFLIRPIHSLWRDVASVNFNEIACQELKLK